MISTALLADALILCSQWARIVSGILFSFSTQDTNKESVRRVIVRVSNRYFGD